MLIWFRGGLSNEKIHQSATLPILLSFGRVHAAQPSSKQNQLQNFELLLKIQDQNKKIKSPFLGLPNGTTISGDLICLDGPFEKEHLMPPPPSHRYSVPNQFRRMTRNGFRYSAGKSALFAKFRVSRNNPFRGSERNSTKK
jgi:hypothetical protein